MVFAGPLSSTAADFWKMVWENQARVIVMVSTEIEKGVVKCHPYWPEKEGDEGTVKYAHIHITLTRSLANDAYVIRRFTVTNTQLGESRAVWQLQYTSWPDHGLLFLDLDCVL